MDKLPDICLVTGAAVRWYLYLWVAVNGYHFDDYWKAYTISMLLLGIGLVGKLIQGVVWITRRMKGT